MLRTLKKSDEMRNLLNLSILRVSCSLFSFTFPSQSFSRMAHESPKHLVFVYGTLKKGEPNFDLIEDAARGKAVLLGNARTVKKWPLIIASRYNIPYILYCEGKGKNITGEVYEVDDTMLATLDELECHPGYYTRVEEEVQIISKDGSNGKLIRPWIYFLKNFRPELLALPYLDNYSSKGSHGLEYVSRYMRPVGDNYYSDVQNIHSV